MELAPIPTLVAATMKKMFEKHQNEITNHIMKHLCDVVKSIMVNVINDVISRPWTFNQLPNQSNTAASKYVPSILSQLNNGNNLDQVIPSQVRILQRFENLIYPNLRGMKVEFIDISILNLGGRKGKFTNLQILIKWLNLYYNN